MNRLKIHKEAAGTESGHAMLEFALVLPLIILFAWAGIEFARGMQYVEFSISTAREMASLNYRCVVNPHGVPRGPNVDFTNPIAVQEDIVAMRQCLNETIGNLRNRILPVSNIKDVRARVSLFRQAQQAGITNYVHLTGTYDGSATSISTNLPAANDPDYSTFQTVITHDTDTVFLNHEGRTQVDTSSGLAAGHVRGFVVVAEVFVPFDSILGRFLHLFNFTPRGFYDASIL